MSGEEIIKIPMPGDLVDGHFLLEREIGRGGFGVVFRAKQLGMQRDVAVKMLMPHAMTHPGVVERFQREARLASSLQHPNAVHIYAFGLHQPEPHIRPLPYIAMELLVGKTLQQHLAVQGKLGVEEAIDVLQQSLASLAEAHKKGIIHRDLKPENIFIAQRDGLPTTIKVLDFGIAKAVSGEWDPQTQERLTRTGFIAGTAEYMAPEQATGAQEITQALDIYAMGCIAYQLVTGRVPYSGNSPMEIAIKHLSEPVPALPEELRGSFIERVIAKAMAKEPHERFPNAEAFREVLISRELDYTPRAAATHTLRGRSDQRGDAHLAPPVAADEPAPSNNRTLLLLGGAGALLLVLIAVLLVLILQSQNSATPPEPIAAPASAPAEAPRTEPAPPPASAAEAPPATAPAEPTAAPEPDQQLTFNAEPVNAQLFHNDKLLGQTPFTLTRADLPDPTFTVELRAEGYETALLTIDWEAPPEDNTLLASLKRANARNTPTRRANPAQNNNKSNKKQPQDDKGGKTPPPLFDLGGGKPKADKTPPPILNP